MFVCFVCVRFYMLLLVCVRLWETVALGGLSCCCQATRCSKPQTRSDHIIVVSCNLISLFGARDRQSSDLTSTFTLCLHFCIFAWPDSRRILFHLNLYLNLYSLTKPPWIGCGLDQNWTQGQLWFAALCTKGTLHSIAHQVLHFAQTRPLSSKFEICFQTLNLSTFQLASALY